MESLKILSIIIKNYRGFSSVFQNPFIFIYITMYFCLKKCPWPEVNFNFKLALSYLNIILTWEVNSVTFYFYLKYLLLFVYDPIMSLYLKLISLIFVVLAVWFVTSKDGHWAMNRKNKWPFLAKFGRKNPLSRFFEKPLFSHIFFQLECQHLGVKYSCKIATNSSSLWYYWCQCYQRIHITFL